MKPDSNNLIWIDLEMTGLSPTENRIIEIATIVTNSNLDVLAEGPVFAIKQTDEHLSIMDEWNVSHHTRSGLVNRVRHSNIDEQQAESQTLAFLSRYVPPGKSPMCGNSICQDRRFLCRYMPELAEHFHYRNLDVSTIKILAQHWAPDIAHGFKKESEHLALQDVLDSIAELKHYRKYFFINKKL